MPAHFNTASERILRNCWFCIWLLFWAVGAEISAAADKVSGADEPALIRKQTGKLLEQLGNESYKAREQATAGLIALGPSVVPLVAAWANHNDPEIAYRVRTVLRRLHGTPGEAVEGLTLAAALVGEHPRRGQAAAFWLSIRNVSDHDIYLFRYMWDLRLKSVQPRSVSRTVGARSPATFNVCDFYLLKPGQTVGFMMDADPDAEVQEAMVGKVRLEVSLPPQAREAAPGAIFSGSEELISGPVEMSFVDPPSEIKPKTVTLAKALADGTTGADTALAAAPEMADAVRWGLRMADSSRRWRVFEFACRHPHAELEDAIIEFLSRYGARIRNEEQQMRLLSTFAAALPPERKWPFYNRMALAISYDWRTLDNFVLSFSSSGDGAERAAAARLALRLHECGVRLVKGLGFAAWELFTTTDAALRNPAKAVELAKAGLELEPNEQSLRLAVAAFADDRAAIRQILDQATTSSEQNNLAYDLVSRFPIGSVNPDWAIELASKAIAETPEDDRCFPYFADTLATSYAFKGEYRKALEWQEKSLARVAADDLEQPGITARTAYYAALLGAAPEDRPRLVTECPPLKTTQARDAVLERLTTEKSPAVRATLLKLLATCYPTDAKAKQALEAPAK